LSKKQLDREVGLAATLLFQTVRVYAVMHAETRKEFLEVFQLWGVR